MTMSPVHSASKLVKMRLWAHFLFLPPNLPTIKKSSTIKLLVSPVGWVDSKLFQAHKTSQDAGASKFPAQSDPTIPPPPKSLAGTPVCPLHCDLLVRLPFVPNPNTPPLLFKICPPGGYINFGRCCERSQLVPARSATYGGCS